MKVCGLEEMNQDLQREALWFLNAFVYFVGFWSVPVLSPPTFTSRPLYAFRCSTKEYLHCRESRLAPLELRRFPLISLMRLCPRLSLARSCPVCCLRLPPARASVPLRQQLASFGPSPRVRSRALRRRQVFPSALSPTVLV